MSNTITVTLSKPIRLAGKDVTEVTVRTHTIGDEEDAMQKAVSLKRKDNVLTSDMMMTECATGIPYEVLRGMSPADYMKLQEARSKVDNNDMENPTDTDGTQQTS